jgi:hypothetical protein
VDLAQFQLIRPMRSIQPEEHIALGPEVTIPPKPQLEASYRAAPVREEWKRFTLADLPAKEYAEGNEPLAMLPPAKDLTLFQRAYAVVNWYDRWLRSFNDRIPPSAVGTPSGVAAAERLAMLLKDYGFRDAEWYEASMKVLLGYHHALKILMTTNPKTEPILDTAVLLTRRVLVAALLSPR